MAEPFRLAVGQVLGLLKRSSHPVSVEVRMPTVEGMSFPGVRLETWQPECSEGEQEREEEEWFGRERAHRLFPFGSVALAFVVGPLFLFQACDCARLEMPKTLDAFDDDKDRTALLVPMRLANEDNDGDPSRMLGSITQARARVRRPMISAIFFGSQRPTVTIHWSTRRRAIPIAA
jgi:hypothetical protein